MLPNTFAAVSLPMTIHSGHLVKALRGLLYSTSNKNNPLENLLIVHHQCARTGTIQFSNERRFALQTLLLNVITEHYQECRRLLSLSRSIAPLDAEHLIRAIKEDVNSGSPELIGWSWLYYRFVQVDYALSAKFYCEETGIEQRTLQRYQKHGVRRLLDYLQAAEQKAWQQQRTQILHGALPSQFPPQLIGREKTLETIWNHLIMTAPSPILITGAAGIGKTAVLHELARRSIHSMNIGGILWIDHPGGLESVQVTIAEYVAANRANTLSQCSVILIVMDEIAHLLHDLQELEHLLNQIPNVKILLSHTRYVPFTTLVKHIALEPLTLSAAPLFFERQLSERGLGGASLSDVEMAYLWELANGIPRAMIQALHDLLGYERPGKRARLPDQIDFVK